MGGGCKLLTLSYREGLGVNPLTTSTSCPGVAFGGHHSWPILTGVDMSIPYCLVLVMMCPLYCDSLELTVHLVRYVDINDGHLVPPQKQLPPQLDAALEAYVWIKKTTLLVSNINVVHLIIVLIEEIPP